MYGAITLLGSASQRILLTHHFVTLLITRTTLLSYNPQSHRIVNKNIIHIAMRSGLGLSRFARRYLGNSYWFLFLRVLRCFTSPGTPHVKRGHRHKSMGFPHSEIFGSKVTRHLPEAYRSQATSFIAL